MKSLSDYNYFTKKDILFFCSFTIFLTYLILYASFYATYLESSWKLITVACPVLLLISEAYTAIITKQEYNWSVVAILLTAVLIMTAEGLNENSVAISILYIFCARNISFEKTARVALFVTIICVCVVVISAKAELIPNYLEFGRRNRAYLGFRYSLYGPALIANASALWIYIRKSRITIFESFLLVGINYWFFYYTNSRLSFFITIALVACATMMRSRRIYRVFSSKTICAVMVVSFVVFAIFSILITLKYDPNSQWMYSLNGTLENRLSLGKDAFVNNGLHLFPNNDMKLVGNGLDMSGLKSTEIYNYVDCLYLQLLLKYGILSFLILMGIVTYALYQSYKCGDILFLVIMTFIGAQCVINDLPKYIHFNTFWLAIGYFINTKNNEGNC